MQFVSQHKGKDYDFHDSWFPSPYLMNAAGIKFAIINQHPGDAIITGSGALHFVFNQVCHFSGVESIRRLRS